MEGPSFRLDGKVAIVTGAGQGFGKAFSLALAQAGATIAVTDLGTNAAGVQAVCDKITSTGGTARGYELDVRETASIQGIMDRVVADLGGLDIIVNNAGVTGFQDPLEITEADWDGIHNVNLKGLFFCAQAAARHMIAQGSGRIINIASEHAVLARASGAHYVSSKSGLAGLTRVLALAWAKKGLTVNAVAPGLTNTHGADEPPMPKSKPRRRVRSSEIDAEIDRSPIGRPLEAYEVVGSVVFLASDASAAVNGHLLVADAGWTVG